MNQDTAREVLLTHSRSSKNGSFPETVSFETKMTNPLCGDHVELKIHSTETEIIEIGYKAQACAICSASASLLCQEAKGHSFESVMKMIQSFETSIMDSHAETPWPTEIKNLNCFEHIKVTPSRKVCALLPWVALKSGLKSGKGIHS